MFWSKKKEKTKYHYYRIPTLEDHSKDLLSKDHSTLIIEYGIDIITCEEIPDFKKCAYHLLDKSLIGSCKKVYLDVTINDSTLLNGRFNARTRDRSDELALRDPFTHQWRGYVSEKNLEYSSDSLDDVKKYIADYYHGITSLINTSVYYDYMCTGHEDNEKRKKSEELTSAIESRFIERFSKKFEKRPIKVHTRYIDNRFCPFSEIEVDGLFDIYDENGKKKSMVMCHEVETKRVEMIDEKYFNSAFVCTFFRNIKNGVQPSKYCYPCVKYIFEEVDINDEN